MVKFRILMIAALLSLGIGQSLLYAQDPNDVNEPNEVPIANAGPDQTVFADINGIALVQLDGSDSNDIDNDISGFLWTWTINGQPQEANGVAPIIELPVGVHVISLVVSDDNNVSKIDDVNITVLPFESLEVEMKFTPQALNCRSNGKWVMAHITLPEGFDVNDVNTLAGATIEPFGVPSISFQVSPDENNITFVFSRADLCEALETVTTQTVDVNVVGFLEGGQPFFGTDTIKLLNKAPKPPKAPAPAAALKSQKLDADNSAKPKGKK